jgi:hypothetical protein
MNLQEIKSQFDKMDEQEQWAWLVVTDLKKEFVLWMDNDTTSIYFKSDEDANYPLYFKDDIGNRCGVEHLLKAIGVDAQDV